MTLHLPDTLSRSSLGRRRKKKSSPGARVMMPDGSMKALDATFTLSGGGTGFSAAQRSGNRGYVVFPQLDTRREITTLSRTEMLRKSRWLYDNVGFAKRTVSGISRMMGSLHPDPVTKDSEWKKEALAYFWSVAKSPLLFCRNGKFNFVSYQRFITRRWLIDGDMAHVFSMGPTGATMVAPYEAHQIRDDGQLEGEWYDGIQVDAGNRLRRLGIADLDTGSIRTYSAAEALLSAHWERAGQVRGVTPFHAALTRMLDVRELSGDIMAGIKRSNLIGFYLHSPDPGASMLGEDGLAGGLQTHIDQIVQSRLQAETVDGNESSETTVTNPANKEVKIEDLFAAAAIPEMRGFEPKVLHDGRPPQAQMNLMDWFIRECSLSFDYHPEILWNVAAMNGNTSRLVKEDAESASRAYREAILAPFCQRYWFHVIGSAIARGDLREPDVGRWDEVEWQHPKRMTIDRGNEGQLNLDEMLRPGARTLSYHWGEQQQNWEHHADQWMDEIDYFVSRAREKGWSDARVAALESKLLAAPQGAAAIDPSTMMTSEESPAIEPEEPVEPGMGELLKM